MKVLDLLNKITNGEEVPKKINYQFKTFELDDRGVYVRTDKVIDNDYGYKTLLNYVTTISDLNYRIEIIEEDKEIEDTKYMRHHETNGKCYIESKGHKYYVPYDLLLLIDDLVKAVNELKKDK